MDFDPDKAMVGLKQFFFRFFYKLSKFDPHMKAVFFVTAVFVLILMLITSKTAFSGYSLSFENFGFSLSNTLLFFTALIAPISWFVFKYNFYIHLNGMSFLEPVVLFFSSAVCLKIYDFNSPIWNRMTSSFLWIMGSITIIHVVYPT